jgi:hypothetical protein
MAAISRCIVAPVVEVAGDDQWRVRRDLALDEAMQLR